MFYCLQLFLLSIISILLAFLSKLFVRN
ncbi:hypothetical protein Mgra_00002035 [Meloidogyne graminicola]|uniref:Uncharacterized protein n=1 Tax=Meloidogyne graminicola TaxID=189291 RepID=A0A8T0A048_9BILA|nr:hypothetical protein Mgra_00002035 [Meloidogyne graminicola]